MHEGVSEVNRIIKVHSLFLSCTLGKWDAFDHINTPNSFIMSNEDMILALAGQF